MNQKSFHHREFFKLDGRKLHLYATSPLLGQYDFSATLKRESKNFSHLRWHPLRGEWVAYASHRQNRTFLPPKEYNPLAPVKSPEVPTELPQGDYEVAVFENMFPSLELSANLEPELIVPTRPANGACEVIVFAKEAEGTLAEMSLDRVELIIKVLAHRYEELSKDHRIKYILPFENRGVEVGVTLHHPHGQIYAYPFVPPLQERMLTQQKQFWDKHQKTLLGSLIESELRSDERIIIENQHSVAFLPAWARYPYEVWIAPKRAVTALHELEENEIKDLSITLKAMLLKYDHMWDKRFPYLMCFYSAPTDGEAHPEWHFHIEFYPPYRTRDRLKYLAGTELGAGMFVNDSIPEEKAKELRDVKVDDYISDRQRNPE